MIDQSGLRISPSRDGPHVMTVLLMVEELPEGFVYPHQFIRLVECGLTRLEPWWILDGPELRERIAGLQGRYPHRTLVPFAARQDRDDVACWDGTPDRIVIIHDFASIGWEHRGEIADVYAWLRQAIEDFIEFDT